MQHINWQALDVDRMRPDRPVHTEKGRFEGVLGVAVSATPMSISSIDVGQAAGVVQTETVAPFDCHGIVEEIAISVADCGSEISLQWDTAELGPLRIEVRREGDQVEVIIDVAEAGAAELLERHGALLNALLAEEGMELVRYAVLIGSSRRSDSDSERNDSEAEISSLLGVIRRASSS